MRFLIFYRWKHNLQSVLPYLKTSLPLRMWTGAWTVFCVLPKREEFPVGWPFLYDGVKHLGSESRDFVEGTFECVAEGFFNRWVQAHSFSLDGKVFIPHLRDSHFYCELIWQRLRWWIHLLEVQFLYQRVRIPLKVLKALVIKTWIKSSLTHSAYSRTL